jgi:serine/threonine protein kinase
VSAPLRAGDRFGPELEVISHLRRGNDLDVYDAWSFTRGTRCIVKALRPDRTGETKTRQQLAAEGELLVSLTHPHIVRGYGAVRSPLPGIVLETLAGETLAHLVERGDEPTAEDLGHLGLQLGSALRYLHSCGFLHLDLKPSNVIVEAGRAKLIDLSLARPPGRAEPGIGTWHYLAPEQAMGAPLGAPADVWGLGCVLFETATGEAPFDDDPAAWASATDSESGADPERYPQLERRARDPRAVAPVDDRVAQLIAACLEPEPRSRPPIERVLMELEALAALPERERRWADASPWSGELRAVSSVSKAGFTPDSYGRDDDRSARPGRAQATNEGATR